MAGSSDDAVGDATGDQSSVDEDAVAALGDALAAVDGDPTCARCPKPADYFLYHDGRVETFVCWEHVSPFSATVDGEGDAPDGRPVALSL